MIDFGSKFFICFREVTNERLIDESNVQIREVTNNGFTALNYLFNDDFQGSDFVMLIDHFFFKIDFLNFFANIHVICQIFLSLLFEEIFISWVNFAEILKLLKNLFTFVKSHVILCAEIVKYSFGHKIYLHCLVCLYFLLDFIHNSLIKWTEENFSVVLFVLKWVEVWLWYFFSIDSFEFDAVLENLREVHFVFGEKGATLPFCEENFVETFLRLS